MSARSAWTRRPSSAVARLGNRSLLLLSARDLLRAARAEKRLLVAFAAPSTAAMAGFARAAREMGAPLLLVRPSGGSDERGPTEARDDAWFAEQALRVASDLRFALPMALLKDPPRVGTGAPEAERVRSEIEAGFTGVSIAARVEEAAAARDAALSAAEVCRLDLGLEVVPIGGSAQHAVEVARGLAARGSPPSALRITGQEREAAAFADGFPELALSTADESSPEELIGWGLSQLTATGPFLRALHKSVPGEVWEQLEAWSDAEHATIEQSAARHQRLIRQQPEEVQDKLEALAYFEALELFERAGARGSGELLAAQVARIAAAER